MGVDKNIGKLAGQTAIYGVSSILARLLNYLLVTYYTRFMTTAEYGVITDIYALIPFALVVLTLGLESGYFRFAGKAESEQERRTIFATAWGGTSLAALLFFGLVMLFRTPLAEAMGYADSSCYLWIVAAVVVLDVVCAIPFARLRQQGRAGRFVAIRMLFVVLNLALCILFYSARPEWLTLFPTASDPGYAFVANLIANVVTLLALLPTTDRIAPRISRRTLRMMLLYSLPLLISGIAGTANEFIDRQMIKYLYPGGGVAAMEALGVYGAVCKIAVVMTMFTQMYRFAAEPFFLSSFPKDDFKRTTAEATKFFIIISVGIFLVIGLFADLFALIVGPDFREGIGVLPLILLSNMLSGVVLNLSFWYKQSGATKFAIYITGIGLIFTVIFNIMLVPALGYVGAAVARLLCEAAMVVSSWLFSRKRYPIPYDLRRIGEYLLLGGVLYGAGMLCGGLAVGLRYAICAVLAALFGAYALRRENINPKAMVKAIIKRK